VCPPLQVSRAWRPTSSRPRAHRRHVQGQRHDPPQHGHHAAVATDASVTPTLWCSWCPHCSSGFNADHPRTGTPAQTTGSSSLTAASRGRLVSYPASPEAKALQVCTVQYCVILYCTVYCTVLYRTRPCTLIHCVLGEYNTYSVDSRPAELQTEITVVWGRQDRMDCAIALASGESGAPLVSDPASPEAKALQVCTVSVTDDCMRLQYCTVV